LKKKIRIAGLLIADTFSIIVSLYIAFWLRFDGNIEATYLSRLFKYLSILIAIKVGIFIFFKLYRSLWEYASIDEMIGIIFAVFVANTATVSFLVFTQAHFPRSVYIMTAVFDLLFIGGVRFVYRAFRRVKNKGLVIRRPLAKRVIVVGAGDAGALIIKELRNHSELNYNIVGIVDDSSEKKGQRLNGIPILGSIKTITSVVEKYLVDEIIIAIPSASKKETRDILEKCKKTGTKIKILPGVYELIDGKVTVNQIRDVNIEDLLGRNQVHLDTDLIESYIEGKKVLVTGAGGSIGSELCRQISRFNPKELIILDIYENGLYDLQNELNNKYNSHGLNKVLNLSAIIGSVRDRNRLKSIFDEFNPDVVFHAAAHKHVPLMENNPYEAVKNNIIGTYNLLDVANENEVSKVVLISTDKAVNPTNVMGATKRFAEMLIQAFDAVSRTDFVAVRFGNVLGSNGSVIPLFKKQICEGGPVTVTHEEITRYFMTIPEASQLVLQAGSMANGGEIFVLDMGEPVKIIDLASDLIRLSGFKPNEEIQILITGLRPGEKLYEELLMNEEGLKDTYHEKIFIGKPLDIKYDDIKREVEILNSTADLGMSQLLIEELRRFVPSYKPNEEVNGKYLNKEKV
jgi:FlaA1/EpsC-like NDP-sugar epimerase